MDIDFLRRAVAQHVFFQRGCYISEVTDHPSGGFYISSKFANDIVWNRAIAFQDSERQLPLDWVREQAHAHARTPAIICIPSGETYREFLTHRTLAEVSECWMFADQASFNKSSDTTIGSVQVFRSARPPDDFLSLFENLYDDAAINDFFKKNYVTALAAATSSDDTAHHLLLRINGTAVACASIYVGGDLAGLYNVGTHHNFQKRGYGTYLSRRALNIAFDEGAKTVFLQCAVGTHVEKMYKLLGFSASAIFPVFTIK